MSIADDEEDVDIKAILDSISPDGKVKINFEPPKVYVHPDW